MRRSLPALLACAIILGLCATSHAADLPAVKLDDKDKVQQGSDIAWMLVATGLVLVMVPGLALFYGGMVRRKNALGTMMHSMIALSVIGIQWVLFGYSLAFGEDIFGIIGGFAGGGIGSFIFGVLNLLIGILLLSSPVAATLAVPFVFGILLLIEGIALIVWAFRVRP